MKYERLTLSHDRPIDDDTVLGVRYYAGQYVADDGKVKKRYIELRFREVYNRLRELEDKIEDGRLVFADKKDGDDNANS